jgi:hypothetical protein
MFPSHHVHPGGSLVGRCTCVEKAQKTRWKPQRSRRRLERIARCTCPYVGGRSDDALTRRRRVHQAHGAVIGRVRQRTTNPRFSSASAIMLRGLPGPMSIAVPHQFSARFRSGPRRQPWAKDPFVAADPSVWAIANADGNTVPMSCRRRALSSSRPGRGRPLAAALLGRQQCSVSSRSRLRPDLTVSKTLQSFRRWGDCRTSGSCQGCCCHLQLAWVAVMPGRGGSQIQAIAADAASTARRVSAAHG